MRNLKKILLFIPLAIMLSSFQLTEDEDIVGVWVLKDNEDVKLIFKDNFTVKEFVDNSLLQEYKWSITKEYSDSGLLLCFLDLVNINDNEDKYSYEITTLNNKYLTLIYLEGAGLKPATYIKN